MARALVFNSSAEKLEARDVGEMPTTRSADETNSASVLDSAVTRWSLDPHSIAPSPKKIIYPDLERWESRGVPLSPHQLASV